MPGLVLHTRVVTGSGGGPEKTILNSPRFLSGQGYPMVCAYMRDPADPGFAALEAMAADRGAELVAVDDTGAFDWRVVGRFVDLCARLRPAIWHAHDYKSNLVGLLVRRRIPMQLVTTVHGWVVRTWKTPLYYAIDRWCLRRYDHVICVSEDLHADCRGLGIPDARLSHVPNAIDVDEFRRHIPTGEAKRTLGLDPETLLIGAVGRLAEEKRFDSLIRAVADLRAEGLDVVLRIAGEGPDRSRLERLVAELGLGASVGLLGYRADTIALYSAFDVFALSSAREGLPNVVLEAMALGVPVVATRIAGVPGIVEDGVNGTLVEPRGHAPLVEALRPLLADPARRARMGEAGRRTVETRFGFAARMERIRHIYDALPGLAT